MKAEAAAQLVGQGVAFLPEDDVRRTSYDRRRNWRDWTANGLTYGLLVKVETQVVSRPDRRRMPFRGAGQPVEREDQRLTVCTIQTPDNEEHLIRPMALVATSAQVEKLKADRQARKEKIVAGARRAEAIKARLEGIGEVERNGGDEFAILLTLDEAETIASTFERYTEALEKIQGPGHSTRARVLAAEALDPSRAPEEADGPHEGRVDQGGTDR